MPKKAFQSVDYASTITFDADLSKNYQVTLTGSPTVVIAGGQEGDELNILLIQGGSGSYSVTWPSSVTWATRQAPNLSSTVGRSDLITLVKRGSSWQDKIGAPSRLPSRVTDRGLSTIALVGATASILLNLSGGGGQGVGNLPNAIEVRSKSGSELSTQINGTGSVQIGSGVLTVGVLSDRPASTVGSAVLKVTPTPNTANGTGTLIVNGAKGGAVCYADTDGSGYTKCDANNGTQACKVATLLECL